MTDSTDRTARSKCPTCSSPADPDGDHFPFCSKRCRQVDLGRWLNEDYRVSRPIEHADLDQGE